MARISGRNAYMQELYHKDPEHRTRVMARKAVREAWKRGELLKPTECQAGGKYGEQCIGGPLEAHHCKSYNQEDWLVVEWLCLACHAVADQQFAAQQVPITDVVDWQAILKLYGNSCAYCGDTFYRYRVAEQDHVIPLSKGGRHITDNVVPACRTCNALKQTHILRKPAPGKPESVLSLIIETLPAEVQDGVRAGELKFCYHCEKARPISEFAKDAWKLDGRNVKCTTCRYTVAHGHARPETKVCDRCNAEKSVAEFRHGLNQRGLECGIAYLCLVCETSHLYCTGCKSIKERDEFTDDKDMPGTGKKSWCAACCTNARVERCAEDPAYHQKLKTSHREYNARPEVKAATAEYNRNYQGAKEKRAVAEKPCTSAWCGGTVKPASAFSANTRTSTGLASWCKACVARKTAELRAKRKLGVET